MSITLRSQQGVQEGVGGLVMKYYCNSIIFMCLLLETILTYLDWAVSVRE